MADTPRRGTRPRRRLEPGFRENFPVFRIATGARRPYVPRPAINLPHPAMSKHNSLRSNATVGGKRSVLKRFERVKLLKERGEWKAGRSPVGLPKTKHEG